MPAPKELDPSTSVTAYWGSELRRLREAMGWSQQELAKRPDYMPALEALQAALRRKGDMKEARAVHKRIQDLKQTKIVPTNPS